MNKPIATIAAVAARFRVSEFILPSLGASGFAGVGETAGAGGFSPVDDSCRLATARVAAAFPSARGGVWIVDRKTG
jgi:hypothetical protein